MKALSPSPPVGAAWRGRASKAASARAPVGLGLAGSSSPCYLLTSSILQLIWVKPFLFE